MNGAQKNGPGLLETGLLAMNAVMRTVQSSIETLAGQKPPAPANHPPLNGPRDVDAAVSELANRALRIARQTPWGSRELAESWQELVRAAGHCFNYVDLRDGRNLILPLQLPLSLGTLLVQSALRGLALYEVVGARRFAGIAAYLTETFSDLPVYISLQYKELIEKHAERLRRAPGDSAARLELGRIYTKCGLYAEATRELGEAAKDPAVRAAALHEAAVANYRAGQFQQAIRDGVAALSLEPSNERARAWLWLSAQKLGGYPAEVPVEQRMEVKAGYHPPAVEFEDVAPKLGLDKTSAGRGIAVFDFNNDGYLDVAVAAAHAGCSLYRNNGDGTFTDVSVGSGLDDCVNGFAVTVGDYNNDGYPDLFVTRLGFFGGEAVLYRNNGNGTFTDVTSQAGLNSWGPAFTASWVDYDCDGHLDLFIANNLGSLFERKAPNRLFHNNGDGTFTEVSEQAGIVTMWPTIGSAWGDYNNDGLPDLFLSNATGRSQLFRNNGDGTFTDVSSEAGIHDFSLGTTALWLDYDNDGWLDLAQFTWSDHDDVIHTMRTGEGPPDGSPMRLYHNNRDGTFRERSRELGLTGCWGTMSGNAGDFNNDGCLDLVLGNGGPRMDRLEPLVLLENDGNGRFHNVTFAAGLPFVGKGHGANLADLFGDGRLSVLVASGGGYPGDLLTTSVYRPKKLAGNFLNVRLTGTKSNRSAIGARVSMEAGGRRQYREVSGGTNFGCLPFEQHFGLGKSAEVEALEIRWPSGLRQRLEKLPANRTIRITEGQSAWEDVYHSAASRTQTRLTPPGPGHGGGASGRGREIFAGRDEIRG